MQMDTRLQSPRWSHRVHAELTELGAGSACRFGSVRFTSGRFSSEGVRAADPVGPQQPAAGWRESPLTGVKAATRSPTLPFDGFKIKA